MLIEKAGENAGQFWSSRTRKAAGEGDLAYWMADEYMTTAHGILAVALLRYRVAAP